MPTAAPATPPASAPATPPAGAMKKPAAQTSSPAGPTGAFWTGEAPSGAKIQAMVRPDSKLKDGSRKLIALVTVAGRQTGGAITLTNFSEEEQILCKDIVKTIASGICGGTIAMDSESIKNARPLAHIQHHMYVFSYINLFMSIHEGVFFIKDPHLYEKYKLNVFVSHTQGTAPRCCGPHQEEAAGDLEAQAGRQGSADLRRHPRRQRGPRRRRAWGVDLGIGVASQDRTALVIDWGRLWLSHKLKM